MDQENYIGEVLESGLEISLEIDLKSHEFLNYRFQYL